jgi:hypothetical protein
VHHRYVQIKLKADQASAKSLDSIVTTSVATLQKISGVIACRAMLPAEPSTKEAWDLCLVLDFESVDAIEHYRVHPDHQTFLKEFLGPKVEAKKVWNFSDHL